MLIAIIDCGTNTFNLLIAETRPDKIKFRFRTKRSVKLGSGGITNRIIAKEPIERAINALDDFKSIIEKFEVSIIKVVGTAAIRDAKNRDSFINEVKQKTGFEIQLISGNQEAKLIYQGVMKAMDIGRETSLILDIGGGSVEFIICNNEKIFWKKSYRLGGARLIEIINPSDPIKKLEVNKLNFYLSENLSSFIDAIKLYNPKKLIGSSGSFDTLAALILSKSNNHHLIRNKTHYQFILSEYKSLHLELINSTYLERIKMKGMLRMRADMIVVASLLLTFVLTKSRVRNLHLSTYALKEGLLAQLEDEFAKFKLTK